MPSVMVYAHVLRVDVSKRNVWGWLLYNVKDAWADSLRYQCLYYGDKGLNGRNIPKNSVPGELSKMAQAPFR
jgi:hypothetical protein